MGEQLCSVLGSESADETELFEMYLTADHRQSERVDQEKRDGIAASRLQSSLTVRAG